MSRRRTRLGFSLIEICIVLLIIGLAIIIGSELYKQYQRRIYLVTLNDRISTIHKAIENYVNNSVRNPYHLLPCPADPTLPPTNGNYARAIKVTAQPGYPCPARNGYGGNPTAGPATDLALSPGIVRTNVGARAWPPAGATGPQPPSWGYMRQGAVPVRDLNLGDEYMAEPNGHLFIYAVSETMANLPPQPGPITGAPCSPTPCFTFPMVPSTNDYQVTSPDQSHGAIDIRQPPGTAADSLLEPAGSALYVIISPGRDGAGSYTMQGKLVGSTTDPNAGPAGWDRQNFKVDGSCPYVTTATRGCGTKNVIYYKAPYSD